MKQPEDQPTPRPNRLADILNRGDVALGLSMSYPGPGIIEAMCRGCDFIWIDGQHGQHTYNDMIHAVRTAELMGVPSLVRAPGHEYGVLGPFADMSPSAIMVPMINTEEEARNVVKALRFAPLGMRSYGGRRAVDRNGLEYHRQAEPVIVAQIETLESLRNVEAIAGTPGVDGIFFGSADVRVQMGLPIETRILDNAELRGHMRHIADAASAVGKFSGCIAATPELTRLALDMGYRFISAGSDATILRAGAPVLLGGLRSIIEERQS